MIDYNSIADLLARTTNNTISWVKTPDGSYQAKDGNSVWTLTKGNAFGSFRLTKIMNNATATLEFGTKTDESTNEKQLLDLIVAKAKEIG